MTSTRSRGQDLNPIATTENYYEERSSSEQPALITPDFASRERQEVSKTEAFNHMKEHIVGPMITETLCPLTFGQKSTMASAYYSKMLPEEKDKLRDLLNEGKEPTSFSCFVNQSRFDEVAKDRKNRLFNFMQNFFCSYPKFQKKW